jgi:hypothetical protein
MVDLLDELTAYVVPQSREPTNSSDMTRVVVELQASSLQALNGPVIDRD